MYIFLLTTLFVLAYSQNQYALYMQWDDCSNNTLIGYYLSLQDNANPCTPASCACQDYNGVTVCSETFCGVIPDNFPSPPQNAIFGAQYSASGCQMPYLINAFSMTNGACLTLPAIQNNVTGTVQTISQSATCGGGQISFTSWTDGACTGTTNPGDAATYTANGWCQESATEGGSFQYSCGDGACIHVDSTFSYQGQAHSFSSLPTDCVVPHIVTRDGVKITTSCEGVLRLTHEHLVMTPEGWKEAGSLKKGDFLFSQIGGDDKCLITSIETEKNQRYSGLNCVESEILANGYWISTFGSMHTLPSMWMKWASKVVGIQTASNVGDYLASVFHGLY